MAEGEPDIIIYLVVSQARPSRVRVWLRDYYIFYVKLRQGRHVFPFGQRFTTHAYSGIRLVLNALMGSGIRQEKDLWGGGGGGGAIYREGGFLRLLAPVHTAQPTMTSSPEAGEICQLKALGTVYHGGIGRMYGC